MTDAAEQPPLVLATTNPGKLAELSRLLAPLGLRVVSPRDVLGHELDVEETGTTFHANAELKARAVREATGLWSLADDSGLEVDALQGQPGVRSARFAGDSATDEANNALLLQRLEGVDPAQRGATFRCVMALCSPTGELHTVEGSLRGTILQAPRGSAGFGYDPLFSVAELGGRSLAELSPEEKDSISHRGRALRQMSALLAKLLGSS